MLRSLLVAVLLAIAGCGSGCAASFFPSPPPPPGIEGKLRLYRVADNLYRFPQPNQAEARTLADRFGIKRVIKLNGIEGRDEWPPGVAVVDHRISFEQVPSVELEKRLLDEIDRSLARGEAVGVHCTGGRDRTGWLIMLWKRRHGGDPREVYLDAIDRGFRPCQAVGAGCSLWKSWVREVGWAEDGS